MDRILRSEKKLISKPFYEEKADFFLQHDSVRQRKRWYYEHYPDFKLIRRIRKFLSVLRRPKHLPLYVDFVRWYLVDVFSGKQRRFWGIYQFVALPGEGKTMSMVAHAERVLKAHPDVLIGANFGYIHAHRMIEHWMDIIEIAMEAHKKDMPCLILMDEIHVTFDSSDWRSFPAELLALLSFNRKFSLQFLCSAQIYDRIPKKIRDIANYTVICRNMLGADRLFRCYYYSKDEYETTFSGKKANAKFIREFIADDDFYALYDTLEQVDQMRLSSAQERDKRQEAFDLLFGKEEEGDAIGASAPEASPPSAE